MPQEIGDMAGTKSGCRLLVPVAPAAKTPGASCREAGFLAQLIATNEQLPQTRQRRRAEPALAASAYRATAALIKQSVA